MISRAVCIPFELKAVAEWIPRKKDPLIIWSSLLSRGAYFTSKQTQLLNRLLIKFIHVWCDLQCCRPLHEFTSKENKSLIRFFLKNIHFWCNTSSIFYNQILLSNDYNSWTTFLLKVSIRIVSYKQMIDYRSLFSTKCSIGTLHYC